MGCSDPKKKKHCESKCNDSNKECKTVGKDCKCIPKKKSNTTKKYKILYQNYLSDNKIN